MFLIRLKWINYLLSGFIIHSIAITFCSWWIYPFSLKSFLISGGLLFLWFIITIIFFNITSSINILWSPFSLFKKRKFIYHNKLGYFLIFISSESLSVMEIKPFSIKEVVCIKNTGNLKEMVKEMKEKLDSTFENRLVYIKQSEEKKNNIKVIKSWDGLLIDDDERRDNKINKILKK